MNKAFTKETDFDDDETVAQPLDVLPPGVPNYITPEGARRVRERLRRMIDEELPAFEAAAAGASEAAGARDKESRSTARRRVKELKALIHLLEEHVGRFEVVEPAAGAADAVRFGARVTVLDGDGDERTYLICGVDEAEPENGAVSWISPIAKALLGREVGDEVVLRLPRGEQVLEIVGVAYGEGAEPLRSPTRSRR